MPVWATLKGLPLSTVSRSNHPIDKESRDLISKRYHRLTAAVNKTFWYSSNDTTHSLYVGSYGRGTAIESSDLDVLMELPQDEWRRYDSYGGNGQSRLLQAVRSALLDTWPTTRIHADGQVVVADFSDGMKFEVLPAFRQDVSWDPYPNFWYPDSNQGGRWLTANPKAEQDALSKKNKESNGLLYDTCRHIRYVHAKWYSSYHLSGILIDTFTYDSIGSWQWGNPGESTAAHGDYERMLLRKYNSLTANGLVPPVSAPGSGEQVDTRGSVECLGKVLRFMAG